MTVQWGNPNEKEYYDYMLSYSPVDNVASKVSCPACFPGLPACTTADVLLMHSSSDFPHAVAAQLSDMASVSGC